MRKCASCGTNDAEPGNLLCGQCDLYRVLRAGGYTITPSLDRDQTQSFTCPRHPGAAVMVIDGHETCQACFQGVI